MTASPFILTTKESKSCVSEKMNIMASTLIFHIFDLVLATGEFYDFFTHIFGFGKDLDKEKLRYVIFFRLKIFFILTKAVNLLNFCVKFNFHILRSQIFRAVL